MTLKTNEMKRLIYSILILLIVLSVASCEKKKFIKPELELELVSNEVHLNLVTTELASATVDVRQGNSGYVVEVSDESIVTATNEGVGSKITINGISEGTAVVTVTDALGKTATIDVIVSVLTPNTPTFTWSGQSVRFDRPGGATLTVMPGIIALSDIISGNTQYFIAWGGGFSEGEKTNGHLRIINPDADPIDVELETLKFLKADSDSNYIVFSDGTNGGQLFFTNYTP